MKAMVTLVIRRRSSGYRVAGLAVDSLDHAWTIANVLARSPEYAGCFVAATSFDGSELFTIGLQPVAPACLPPPASQYAASTAAYARPAPLPLPRPAAHPAEVVEAEIVEPFGPPPALPPRGW
jgi:hypothetical protein